MTTPIHRWSSWRPQSLRLNPSRQHPSFKRVETAVLLVVLRVPQQQQQPLLCCRRRSVEGNTPVRENRKPLLPVRDRDPTIQSPHLAGNPLQLVDRGAETGEDDPWKTRSIPTARSRSNRKAIAGRSERSEKKKPLLRRARKQKQWTRTNHRCPPPEPEAHDGRPRPVAPEEEEAAKPRWSRIGRRRTKPRRIRRQRHNNNTDRNRPVLLLAAVLLAVIELV